MFTNDVDAEVESFRQKAQQNLNKDVGGNGWRRGWSGVTAPTMLSISDNCFSTNLYRVLFDSLCCKRVLRLLV